MSIIDRYLCFLFGKVLLISFVTLAGLYIVIDAFGNLDEFLAYGERAGSALSIMTEFYSVRTLAFFDQVSGILAVAACMFSITMVQRSQEMTALMAAGISSQRIVRPLLFASILVSLTATASREFLIPKYRVKLGRSVQDWYGEQQRQLVPRYDNTTDILLGGHNTIAAEQRISEANFRLPETFSAFGRQIVAENAYFQPSTNEHPAGYRLTGVRDPVAIAGCSSYYLGDRPAIFAPNDTPWLKPDECFVVSEVNFEQLEAGAAWRDYSSTVDLISGLRNPSLDYGADVRTAVHARFVRPVLDILLVLLGLPMVLRGEQRNIFVTVGWCLLVVLGFFMVVLTCRALGSQTLLSPALAAWLPLFLFVPLAALLNLSPSDKPSRGARSTVTYATI